MRFLVRIWVVAGLVFLAMPLFIIIPLSFTSGQYLFYTPEMLLLDPAGYSTKWYWQVLHDREWILAVKNSLFIGLSAALLSTVLATLAALGLSRAGTPAKGLWTALILLPQIVPIVVTADGPSWSPGSRFSTMIPTPETTITHIHTVSRASVASWNCAAPMQASSTNEAK